MTAATIDTLGPPAIVIDGVPVPAAVAGELALRFASPDQERTHHR